MVTQTAYMCGKIKSCFRLPSSLCDAKCMICQVLTAYKYHCTQTKVVGPLPCLHLIEVDHSSRKCSLSFLCAYFQVLAVPYTSVLLMFVQKVLTYPAFEVLVLPHLLYHCQSIASNDIVVGVAGIGEDFLHLLTRLVLHKAPLCKTGMDLQCWHQYPLNFRNGMCR